MEKLVTNICAGPYGALYQFYMERPRLAQVILRLALGIDVVPFYRSMTAIANLEEGAVVLDAPCGGGVALSAVRTDQSLRYLGVDISEKMLARFQRRAAALGGDVEAIRGDLRDIPLPDGIADLCLSYNGLHMLPDPRRGLAEMVRCLKPGGYLVGSVLLAEGTRRHRLQLGLSARGGASGVTPRAADLRLWLNLAGIEKATISPERGLAIFRGRKDVKSS